MLRYVILVLSLLSLGMSSWGSIETSRQIFCRTSRCATAEPSVIPQSMPMSTTLFKNTRATYTRKTTMTNNTQLKNPQTAYSYKVFGKKYHVLKSSHNYVERGVASWYGPRFNRKHTSSGERFNMYGLTAAHKTLPLSTKVEVTNLINGKKIVVRINDRGPFVSNRLIDLSYGAAKKLRMVGYGTVPVTVKAIYPA